MKPPQKCGDTLSRQDQLYPVTIGALIGQTFQEWTPQSSLEHDLQPFINALQSLRLLTGLTYLYADGPDNMPRIWSPS